MMQTMGWVQWLTWGTGVTVFAVVIALVIRSAVRAAKRAPEQPSAAARLAREANLPPAVQADLAALNRRKDNGEISEADYEQQRAALLRAG